MGIAPGFVGAREATASPDRNRFIRAGKPLAVEAIEVVRRGGLGAGGSTAGIVREKAFESPGVVVSKSTVPGDAVSAWHHHGARNLYGFVVSGRLKLEFGRAGKESVEVAAGDFFHITPGLIHRDVNPDRHEKAVIVNVSVGEGPAVVNVEAP